MSRTAIRDAAAVASALYQIAKGVTIPSSTSSAASRGAARPWPTQVLNSDARTTSSTGDDSGPSLYAHSSEPLTPAPATSISASRPWPSKAYATARLPKSDADSSLRPAPVTLQPAEGKGSSINQMPEAKAQQQTYADLDAAASQTPPVSLDATPFVSVEAPPLKTPEKSRLNTPTTLSSDTHGVLPSNASETSPISSLNGPSPKVSTADDILQPADEALQETQFKMADAVIGFEKEFTEEYDAVKESRVVPLKAAKVPSSRLGRLFHYGGLGAGLAFGAADTFLRGPAAGSESSGMFMSEQNVARLVDKLSTMRGAALKLGQFLSIQETKLLPPQIEQVLLRVQNSANYMPVWQMNKVMSQELGGSDWKERHFSQFDDIPFASASIGQVHSAILRDDFPDAEMAGKKVAVKVQFPGVQDSIDSDLSYLRWLVSASALLPKGLFLESTLRVLGRELKDECDYIREAEMGRKFRHVLRDSAEFQVPKVVDSLSTGNVLTTEMMRGRPLSMASRYSQKTRDRIAQSILNLALSELFRYRLMQTDPNWSNFLYHESDGKIQLIDFGATREYPKEFMDNWLKMLQAAVRGDRAECIEWSRTVGYLTGKESDAMEQAHVETMIALGEPFRNGAPDPYPFESQTITDRVKAQIPFMLRERLTPPPEETYSLNRKLSGAFLLCARLKAHVRCRAMFQQIESEYKFGPESTGATSDGPFSANGQRRQLHQATRTRRRGINLDDRFPRSKVIIRGNDAVDDSSVESLAPLPTASPSVTAEVPADTSKASVDLLRKVLPAEASSPMAESPITARSESDSATAKPAVVGPALIRGIVIPLKPQPPGPEECCMSGCAHCAYDIYAEDLEYFHEKLSSVRNQLTELSPPVSMKEWRQDLLGDYPTHNDSHSAQDIRKRAQQEVDRVIGDLDPTMKAFLEMERKMKAKERGRSHAVA